MVPEAASRIRHVCRQTSQTDQGQQEIDRDRRALIAALAAGALLGPSACGPTRQESEKATNEDDGKDHQADSYDHRPLLPGVEPVMRVRLARIRGEDARALSAFTLGVAGQRLWVTTPELVRPGRVVYGPVDVRAADGGWILSSAGRKRHGREQIQTATPLAFSAIDRKPIAYQGNDLKGTLHLVRRTDLAPGDFDLVSHIDMEAYLPGVLHKELYADWPVSTFQAQAIAARSFGVCERNFWRSRRHYDVVAGPASQAWSGGDAAPRAHEAVEGTSGLVLTWQGRLFPAYYSAACGGLPASGADAIGSNPANAIAPLSVLSPTQRRIQGCCEESPYASWQVAFNKAEVARALASYANTHGRRDLLGINRIQAIEVASRNPAGRPTRYILQGTRTTTIGAETLRRALNQISRESQGSSGLRASCIEFRTTPSGIEGRGRGFGHGVGLCQYGARTMGRSGASAESILARYYPGATVARGWDPPVGRSRGSVVGA